MSKSEISLLQELMMKQGFVPTYNFTEEKINTVQFICNVYCKQLKARGTGKSKKEAKLNAAKNMLSLLNTNNQISLSVNNSSSSIANIEATYKDHKISPLCEQSTVNYNYIGLVQEFCQQREISAKDILYKVISEDGLPHKKIFTIEVRLGLLCERGTAQCKKSAKQEAAKKLLLRLNPNAAAHMIDEKKILENEIRDLGTRILDCGINKETLSETKLTEKAKSLYCESLYKKHKGIDEKPFEIKDYHILFEKNYSNKIAYDIKEKMRNIRDKYTHQIDLDLLTGIRRDIEKSIEVKIEQFSVSSQKNYMICLRLLSSPRVTQFGMGETKVIAESNAIYNLMTAILIFLNI